MPTLKRLARPVGLTLYWVDVQTFVAGLASVGRANCYQLYAKFDALVAQKQPELEKRPTVRASTLGLVSRLLVCPLSNARQIFNGNNGIALN
jgi:hypothetical protein